MIKKNKKWPLVCIIVVNWNGGEMIEKSIKSLKMTTYPNYKLILVDNNSNDDSVQKLRRIFPRMKVILLNDNYGCSPGRNVALQILMKDKKIDYFCLLDSDLLTIQKDWLNVQINELEKSKEYGISGGKLVFPDNRLQVIIRKDRSNFEEMDKGQYDFIKETDAVWGACMIIKRKVIEKIGFLDENFFYGPDDIDYCNRARAAGFKVLYNGFSKSVHVGSFSGLSPRRDYIYRNVAEGMMIYAFKYLSPGEKIVMIFRQLIRAAVTRKDPFSNFSMTNVIWHLKSLPKRLIYFFIALFMAIKNYKKIKVSSIDGKTKLLIKKSKKYSKKNL